VFSKTMSGRISKQTMINIQRGSDSSTCGVQAERKNLEVKQN
jgi:hypothetical protein